MWESVQNWLRIGKPVTVGYCGDWDSTGLAIPRSLVKRFNEYSGGRVNLEFIRLALDADDVRPGQREKIGLAPLTTHDINKNDKNEIEAMPPQELRDRVEARVKGLIQNQQSWDLALAFEEIEQDVFTRMRSKIDGEVALSPIGG